MTGTGGFGRGIRIGYRNVDLENDNLVRENDNLVRENYDLVGEKC